MYSNKVLTVIREVEKDSSSINGTHISCISKWTKADMHFLCNLSFLSVFCKGTYYYHYYNIIII